jgi:copper transport protein
MRRALLIAVLAVLATPSGALAHATLQSTQPARGAVVPQQPEAVTFVFDEPVEASFGAVRVFDRTGGRIDRGDAFHPGGHGERIAVHLRPELPRGTYTATYRVVSADGHIVSGGSTFSIGRPSATGQTVGDLLAGASSGPVTGVALAVAKGVAFAAIALTVGGLGFLLWTWAAARTPAPDALRARARWLLVGASVAGAVAAAAAVVLQGATAAGISAWSALRPETVGETLSTRFGVVWTAGAAAWLLAAGLFALLLTARRGPRRAPLAALVATLAFLVALPSLGGHAATQRPIWLLVPANVLHVLAMSLWVGGLVAFVALVPAATRDLEPPERTRLLAALLGRFSPLALGAVAVLVAGGLVQAIVEVRTPAHLLDTAFGRAVAIKALLLVALIAVGAWHRRRSIPRLRALAVRGESMGRAGLLVRRALRAEVALVVVVLAVTAALSSYAPSTAVSAGPFQTTTTIGAAQLQLVVDPATVGANAIHLYLLDPRDGRPWNGAKEVTVTATERGHSIGPLSEPVQGAGPGHYVVSAAPLAVPGEWTIAVTVRTSDFDETTRRIQVPVR